MENRSQEKNINNRDLKSRIDSIERKYADNTERENNIDKGGEKGTDSRNEENKKIGDRIKYWSDRKGFSMTRLADKAQISKSTLSGIVNGGASPYLHTLEQICDALNISLEELLEPEKEKKLLSENAKLSEEESELIAEFRKMPPEQRKWLLETVRMLRRA